MCRLRWLSRLGLVLLAWAMIPSVVEARSKTSEQSPAYRAWARAVHSHIDRIQRRDRAGNFHCRLGLKGTVMVHFKVNLMGHLVDYGVMRTSGIRELDVYALALLGHINPVPAPPPGLIQDFADFAMPIIFNACSHGRRR